MEMQGADGFAATGNGQGGKPVAAAGIGGALGGPGIGAGGKVAPVQPMPGVTKTDTMVRGMKGKGEELSRPFRGSPDQVDSRASYYDVYPGARRAAEDALNKEQIPASHRKQVKEYFDAIAPR